MTNYFRLTIRVLETIGGEGGAGNHQNASPGPTSRREALILADQILNRLYGYARKGSRARNDFYRDDLNWLAGVLLRVGAGEHYPLRPTGQ